MGPGVSGECLAARDMQHIAEDHFLWEVVDPETGERQYTEAQKRMMTLYLAPGATDLFTFNRIALQGGIKAGENAPIHMELTYTLIK